jgi:hypothetical protein
MDSVAVSSPLCTYCEDIRVEHTVTPEEDMAGYTEMP